MSAIAIETLTNATQQDLVEVAAGFSPVLLKGAVSHWPAVQKAKSSVAELQQYLLEFDTNLPLFAFEADASIAGRLFYSHDFEGMNYQKVHYSLEQIFANLNSHQSAVYKPALYVGSTNVDRHFPGFSTDNTLDIGNDNKITNIWLGNQSNVSTHSDFPDNFACCVSGKRQFTLFPPEQLENLYIGPLDFNPAGPAISFVDHQNPDFDIYPKYALALEHAITVELLPGDVLFIPSMWWHQVCSKDDFNVMVNYWWKKTPVFQPSPMEALNYALLTISDLPDEQKKIWQNMFNYYVFGEGDFSHIPDKIKGSLGDMDLAQAKKLRAMLINGLNR